MSHACDDHPLSAVLPEIRKSIVRIEVTARSQCWAGTGYIAAIGTPSRCGIVATARHILEVPEGEEVTWRVQEIDGLGFLQREIVFSSCSTQGDAVPYRVNKDLDVGLLWLPPKALDGTYFVRSNEKPLTFIDPRKMLAEGTRVAWGGYAYSAEKIAGAPVLCYFEGVISAAINRADKHVYIIDGHCAEGVSGAPVWGFLEGSSTPQIAGVVSGYGKNESGTPGFCVCEPTQTIHGYLKWVNEDRKNRPAHEVSGRQ